MLSRYLRANINNAANRVHKQAKSRSALFQHKVALLWSELWTQLGTNLEYADHLTIAVAECEMESADHSSSQSYASCLLAALYKLSQMLSLRHKVLDELVR